MSDLLSIACIHIVKEDAPAILALENEPIDIRDSGRLYACERCIDKVSTGKFMKESMDNWLTIHDKHVRKNGEYYA